MKRKRDDGFCELSTKRGQCWYLPREQYIPVRQAWIKGVRMVDTVDFHGAPTTIKLDEIDGVSDVPPEVVRARMDEKRADESDDSLAGAA